MMVQNDTTSKLQQLNKMDSRRNSYYLCLEKKGHVLTDRLQVALCLHLYMLSLNLKVKQRARRRIFVYKKKRSVLIPIWDSLQL